MVVRYFDLKTSRSYVVVIGCSSLSKSFPETLKLVCFARACVSVVQGRRHADIVQYASAGRRTLP